MKKFKFIVILVALVATLCSCNVDLVDTNYSYDYALVKFPDGTSQKIEIKSWKDYDGEQLQITSKDGTVYLVSSFNCILVNEK